MGTGKQVGYTDRIDTPLIYIIFNRPDLTQESFEVIRRIRPARLFVVADGPRTDQPGEADRCAAARAIVDDIDWPCEITRDYSEINLGCARRISTGITAALARVDRAIILEDDCLPHESFFTFCGDILERYAEDTRVMAVTGNNFQSGVKRGPDRYYFSKYFHCWGWATWARAWKHYDHDLSAWPESRKRGLLAATFPDRVEYEYWEQIFDAMAADKWDTWDYRYMFACFSQSGLTVTPQSNLVSNVGFRQDGTHTQVADHPLANIPVSEVGPLDRHPAYVVPDIEADACTFDNCFNGKALRRRYRRRFLKRWLAGLRADEK